MKKYDIAVLGGGIAGFSAALHAGEMGANACLIEKDRIGGTSIKRHYSLGIAREYLNSMNAIDPSGLRRDGFFDHMKISLDHIPGQWMEALANKSVEIKMGNGVLINNTEILAQHDGQEEVIKAGKIIVATGSTPVAMPSLPFDGDFIVSEDDVLSSRKIPENVLIVGGSVLACETAVLLALLGSKVIICHEGRYLLEGLDPDLVMALETAMKKQKIKLLLGKKPVSIYKNNGKIDVTLDGEIKFSTDKIIQALIRNANTGMIDCRSGIRLGDRKEVLVNEKMESSLGGVYAVGSVTGCRPDPVLAEEQGRTAVKNALGKDKVMNQDHVPIIIQTDPEIASVGCTSANAHFKGFRAVEGACDYNALDHSLISQETVGLFKVIADKTSKKVIGVQIVGKGAGEMISLAVLAVKKGLGVSDLATISCAWPSRVQGVKRAARNCLDLLTEKRWLG